MRTMCSPGYHHSGFVATDATHYFLPSPLLNLQTVLAPFLGNSPCILVSCELSALKIKISIKPPKY